MRSINCKPELKLRRDSERTFALPSKMEVVINSFASRTCWTFGWTEVSMASELLRCRTLSRMKLYEMNLSREIILSVLPRVLLFFICFADTSTNGYRRTTPRQSTFFKLFVSHDVIINILYIIYTRMYI